MPACMPGCADPTLQISKTKTSRFGSVTAYSSSLEVSAFGYKQKFVQPIENVYAFMSTGTDTVRVFDDSGLSWYYIDGGDGEDTLSVTGHVDATIVGGADNDTIEGGSGGPTGGTWRDGTPRGFIDLRGSSGFNHVSIGGGNLAAVNPAATIDIDGGTISDLTIDNSKDRLGSDYYFYDDPNSNQFLVTVDSKTGSGTVRHVIRLVQRY